MAVDRSQIMEGHANFINLYIVHKVISLEFEITKAFYKSIRKYKQAILIRTETQFNYLKQERDFIGSQIFKVQR